MRGIPPREPNPERKKMRKLETRVLKFKYRPPVEFLLLLTDPASSPRQAIPAPQKPARTLLPTGLTSLSPDNVKQELTVVGEPGALAELEALQRLLDVKSKELTLTLTVGASQATAKTLNNEPVRLSVVAGGKPYTLEATPHLNSDGSISFSVRLFAVEDLVVINWGAAKERSATATDGSVITTFRRVKQGEAPTFKWGTEAVSLAGSLLPV
jgi:hypothetical protein